jgi:hypothetical protein
MSKRGEASPDDADALTLTLPGQWSFQMKKHRPSKLGDRTGGFTLPLLKETR